MGSLVNKKTFLILIGKESSSENAWLFKLLIYSNDSSIKTNSRNDDGAYFLQTFFQEKTILKRKWCQYLKQLK
jgi:hypothetical protein